MSRILRVTAVVMGNPVPDSTGIHRLDGDDDAGKGIQ